MRIGTETREYEVISSWACLPEGMSFGYTHGIEVDSNQRIYVFHTGSPSVAVFHENGEYMTSWGEEFQGGAHGFYLHHDEEGEHFYITDTERNLVAKTTLEGEVLLRIGTPDLPEIYDEQRTFIPTDVAVGPNGDIYIADGYGQSYVHHYDKDGKYIRSWGGTGSEMGQLTCPHGISVNLRGEEPELYVADRGNNRIQVFTMAGEPKRLITAEMKMPCSFYFFEDEIIFPDLLSRITILDRNDELIAHLGDDPEASKQQGWPNLPKSYYRPDRFSSPHGVCADREGNLYVAEWIEFGRVTKLVRKS
ncbi:NHL repeat-containing protein [Paenibacillus algicola]|uniref:NHL repeat-containing protein n=1 Tax=Paenibacillus algicola TaxID=2565926 RepID=A0A4P8XSK3_9BACL|nr:hypothetical protein [Paenibacillus algicola]QCT03629.1 NHL repeat-containing protein [Paenibacillus algicola]